jgi:hypothetical protein
MRSGLLIRTALAAVLVLCATPCVRAETVSADKAAQIKAAYLLNFVKYTQWPAEAFASPDSPIVLSVVGTCDVGDVLAEAASQSDAGAGRKIKIDTTPLPVEPDGGETAWQSFYDHLQSSHLIYLCGLDPQTAETILRGLGSSATLTVSDLPAFAERGGMLGFVLRENRIIFQANLEAIQKSRIELSAKVLQLAQIVRSDAR